MQHYIFPVTPICKMPYYSRLWSANVLIKRDDLFQAAAGGSKARMLQYILADVSPEKYDVVVTAGGPCSNFNRALALMCSKLGVKMHLIEYTDNELEYDTSLNYYMCNLAGINKSRCCKKDVVETIRCVLDAYKESGLRCKFIYGGGRSLEGMYSYYDAVKEVYEQGVHIDCVFVACGTGTTVAGISAGLQKYFPNAKVYAISTARPYSVERSVLEENIDVLNEYLESEYSLQNLIYEESFLCGGYAKFCDDLVDVIKECISKEGIIIDPTYSGKAFWGMKSIIEANIDQFRNKNILFWNTGGIFNLLAERI